MRLIFGLLVSSVLLSSCQESAKKVQSFSTGEKTSQSISEMPDQAAPNTHHVKVKEILQTSSYTYLFVTENSEEFWIAVRKLDAKIGDDVYYQQALPMKDFKSKELDRVFENVLFIQGNTSTPPTANETKKIPAKKMPPKVDKKIAGIQVNATTGGISIAELFKNKDQYAGQKVKVSGQVVKINNGIMGKNWIHIQDGTADADNYDLTLTTQDKANMGDIISIEGTVYLNKDFGAGYSYDLIIEEAIVK
ncbi:hypothetical protein DWB61_04995 [Ancylomarina euxinus]|uniref:GW domain-containing protein n=1 Tax=Ancylomarina euxinus TaxID=2283627 RepID=A0A425Y670_9BACT|nr:GW dipeptide domain-containing protein [Ancylomarina euxinus]MCZ4694233.1 GW dipeptide domain-containing protein [Ancylomarina euxinus]MUP14436.1 hypothetical protein [Ancylomarina euxinus]RRG23741.1 hypothetical protein DWB61_04995 [Ancylomarina euxinus]